MRGGPRHSGPPHPYASVGIIQLWFHYFRGILVCTRPWEAKQRDALVVGSFTPVSLFVYGNDQFDSRSVTFHNAMPLHIHESAKPSGAVSSLNSLSNFSQLVLSLDLAEASESLLMHSSTEAFICAKLKHPTWKILLSSVRWGGTVVNTKAPCWSFLLS